MMGMYLGCRIYLENGLGSSPWVEPGTQALGRVIVGGFKARVLTNLNPLALKKNWEGIAFVIRSMDFTDLQSVIN